MSNLRALRTKDVSPAIVMESVGTALEAGTVKDIYVVTFDAKGEPTIWASGDLRLLSLAAASLQDLTFKYLNKEIDGE